MPQTAIKSIASTKLSVADLNDARTAAVLGNLLGQESHTSVNNKFVGMISEVAKAKAAIDKKRDEIGSGPGQPVGGVEIGAGDGFLRRYQNGIIYVLPPAAPCWVHGAILDEYKSLGAEGGFLGYPTTDELSTPDNTGRYTHFQRGSIYWSYETGAHEVHGGVRDKWASLGWERSWLGFPRSGEKEYAQGGRVSEFQHGWIFWWPDVGAFDRRECRVRYKGLHCFGEQSGVGSDNAYVIFGSATAPPVPPSAERTQRRDVESGDSLTDNIEVYRGIPGGVVLGSWLFEHDSGDPDAYLNLVKQGVALAGKGVATGCGALFGADAVPVCEGLWSSIAPQLTSAINDLLGTADDLIGASTITLTAKDMVMLAGSPQNHFSGLEYHFESGLLTDGDASYKVYFDIVQV